MNRHSSKIKELIKLLQTKSDSYLDIKIELMNNPRMIEYLYNKHTISIRNAADLALDCNSDSIRTVRMDIYEINLHIIPSMFMMLELLKLYDEIYKEYTYYASKYRLKEFFKPVLPLYSNMTSLEKSIQKVLNKYEKRNFLSYVYKWSFDIPAKELVHTSQKIPINYSHNQIYDFYGMIYSHRQLVQFVIMCEEDDESQHLDNLILQYILFQLNINLLRITSKHHLKSQIKNFLKQLNNTTEYVLINPIKPDYQILKKISKLPSQLITFISEYRTNHATYLKEPIPHNLADSEDEYYETQFEQNLTNSPPDESYVISNEALKRVTKSKNQFKSPKSKFRSDVERMYVVLTKDTSGE